MNTGPGDVLLLGGDLGAGKTTFSRGFVRARTGAGDDLRVTSPTYLLSNSYPTVDEGGGNGTMVYHMDLYRLAEGNKENLSPLNLENVLTDAISIIEWPSRLGELTPKTRMDVILNIDDNGSGENSDGENGDNDVETKRRCMTLVPHGDRWVERLDYLLEEGYLEDLIIEDTQP